MGNIIYKEIFSDWYEKDGFLKSKNKKWVNNFINESNRLDYISELKNMFMSGSHCKTSINIWSMEGSVESGKICSNIILKKYNKELSKIYIHGSKGFVKYIQNLEDLFYLFGLRNVIIELIICINIYIVYKLICKYIKPNYRYIN